VKTAQLSIVILRLQTKLMIAIANGDAGDSTPGEPATEWWQDVTQQRWLGDGNDELHGFRLAGTDAVTRAAGQHLDLRAGRTLLDLPRKFGRSFVDIARARLYPKT
jgi:hypothetical protein